MVHDYSQSCEDIRLEPMDDDKSELCRQLRKQEDIRYWF